MASVRCGEWRVRRVGGGNNPDEASVFSEEQNACEKGRKGVFHGCVVWGVGGRSLGARRFVG